MACCSHFTGFKEGFGMFSAHILSMGGDLGIHEQNKSDLTGQCLIGYVMATCRYAV